MIAGYLFKKFLFMPTKGSKESKVTKNGQDHKPIIIIIIIITRKRKLICDGHLHKWPKGRGHPANFEWELSSACVLTTGLLIFRARSRVTTRSTTLLSRTVPGIRITIFFFTTELKN